MGKQKFFTDLAVVVASGVAKGTESRRFRERLERAREANPARIASANGYVRIPGTVRAASERHEASPVLPARRRHG